MAALTVHSSRRIKRPGAQKNPAEAGLFYFMAPRYFFFIASAALAAGVEVGAARGGHKPTSR